MKKDFKLRMCWGFFWLEHACAPLPAGWDEHVQRRVLLHALCPGCIWLAHVPDEEAWLWAVPPRQLLPVSTQTYPRTFLSICFRCLLSLFIADQISNAAILAKWYSTETIPLQPDPLTDTSSGEFSYPDVLHWDANYILVVVPVVTVLLLSFSSILFRKE